MQVLVFSGKAKHFLPFMQAIIGWGGMESGIGPYYYWRRFGSQGVAVYMPHKRRVEIDN